MTKKKKRDDEADQSSTEPVALQPVGMAALLKPGVTLMIYHRGGTEEARLVPGQSLVVGRHKPADRRIPDRTLSQEHARFTLLEDGVSVEDLGSKNGTWLVRNRIERATLRPGDEVTLGDVIVQVIALGMATAPTLLEGATFRRQLEEELKRAKHFRKRPLAVLAVRASDEEAEETPRGSWVLRLLKNLQPVDGVCLYTPTTALVLLPESNLEAAEKVAKKIRAPEAPQGSPRLVGLAVYPEAATNAYKLIELALDALGCARPAQPVVSASGEPRAEAGGCTVGDGLIAGANMQEVMRVLGRVSSSRIPVLLLGETGTGKEELARHLHKSSPRRDEAFIAVNCAAIPEQLVESTLFGHEKGAFTGAEQRKRGCFEAADGGTLFLDEIGDLPLDAQGKLLRALQENRISPVGSTQEIEVDVRIVAATHRDLKAMMKEGLFREDLWYRLHGMEIRIPPLRVRQDELENFFQRFVAKANKDEGRNVRGISKEAMDLMYAYPWPGNVRELQSVIHRAVVLAEGDLIQPEDLPQELHEAQEEAEDPLMHIKEQSAALKARMAREALAKAKGDENEAAKALGKSARTIRRWNKSASATPPKPPKKKK